MSIPECIDVGGRTIPLIVRFRRKARHLRLKLTHKNQVVVSVPLHLSSRDLLSFIGRQKSWLEQQLAHIPQASDIGDWLREYPFLSAYGKRFSVRVEQLDNPRAKYQFENSGAEVVLSITKKNEDFDEQLLKLVRVFAKDVLACRLNYHAKRLNLKFERFTVRDQAGRWGSCSSKRCISLNWRLVLVEPELQDYIILHELAHLTEMNHSKHFWNLLDSYDPLRLDHESALKEMAGRIMRVGRS